MLQLPRWATAILALALIHSTDATSMRPLPLHERALSHPAGVRTRIIPRAHRDGQLQKRSDASLSGIPAHDDSFLLSFDSHGRPVTLSLRPSANLLHPQGVKVVETHTNELGVRTVTERVMQRSEALVYEGVVVGEDEDLEQWVKEEMAGLQRDHRADNWARIVVVPEEADTDEVRFQGAFSAEGDLFTIHSTPQYLATREELDPEPPLLHKRGLYEHPSMVIVREGDILSPHERVSAMRKRGHNIPSMETVQSLGCGHDDLSFNTDPMHPVYEHSLDNITPWTSTFLGMPIRRDPSSAFTLKDRSLHDESLSRMPHSRLIKRQGDIQTGGNSSASSNFINSIGSTVGCPRSSMVVFMGVAADCTYTNRESCGIGRFRELSDRPPSRQDTGPTRQRALKS